MSVSDMPPEFSLLTSEPVKWYDRWASWLADHCSPILIKECRQALKSRQFLWTFILVLLAAMAWSFLGLGIQAARAAEETGPEMLLGYLMILSFPLLLVVPFVAFRALASELDGETLQLLSITTLSPKQIINGKLISSLLQMLLYLSVLVPCIAFTYLLRGVDLQDMFWLVGILVGTSISLCAFGLMAAGLTKLASARWIIAVGLTIGLLLGLLIWLTFLSEFLTARLNDGNDEAANVMLIIFFVLTSTGWVCYQTAAALISFPAEDRSSQIRLALLVQHLVLVGAALPLTRSQITPTSVQSWLAWIAFLSAHYWLLVGSLTSAENPGMSDRVRRKLPQSILGQSFLGLLMPGPGRGYLFALTQIWGWASILWLLSQLAPSLDSLVPDFSEAFEAGWFFVVNAAHATIYLSLTWLLLSWIRGSRKLHPLAGLVTLLFLYTVIHVATASLHGLASNPLGYEYQSFSVLLSGNWFSWYGAAVGDNLLGFNQVGSNDAFAIVSIIVSITAFGLTLICLLRACRELVATPGAIPDRVLKELKENQRKPMVKGESIEDIFAARKNEREERTG